MVLDGTGCDARIKSGRKIWTRADQTFPPEGVNKKVAKSVLDPNGSGQGLPHISLCSVRSEHFKIERWHVLLGDNDRLNARGTHQLAERCTKLVTIEPARAVCVKNLLQPSQHTYDSLITCLWEEVFVGGRARDQECERVSEGGRGEAGGSAW